jgi:tetratricopeptide (TPR) repeat protein
VIAYSLKDQSDQAAKLLAQLMKNPKAAVSSDLMQLTAARMLFQNGYFDPSIKYYEKIPKASPYWTEAQEEMGWAYIRKGQPNNALALSQSLVQAGFNYQVSPETYFVRSLSQLKMCDYTGVMGSLNEFPQRFKERTKALEKLSQDSATAEVANGIETLKTRKVGIQDLGKIAKMLPRRFSQDQKLFELAQSQMHLESEVKNAEKLLTAPQPVFENIKTAVLQQMQSVKTASYDRVKELARDEVTETKEILRKLHIVEAEVIQQVSFADKIAKNAVDKGDEKKGVTGYKGVAQTVSFPAEKEVWVDELSNYRLDVKKACTVKR